METTHLKKAGQSFWDANPCGGNWTSYCEFMEWIRKTEPYFFEILDRHDWRGKQVIEVGCGQGTTFNYLPHLGAAVAGVDMSFQSLQQARAGARELGFEPVRITLADAERLPFMSNYFDAVISAGVLHHTPGTAAGVKEIHRVLKPGGLAIVMLYRSGNPKWWATRTLRGISRGMDWVGGKPYVLAEQLRARQRQGQGAGTALLELFGVPILKAFSNHQARRLFEQFSEVRISNHQPGFRRMADIVPALRLIESGLSWIDHRMKDSWGFYQVLEARK